MDKSLEKLAARTEVYRLLSQAYHTPEVSFLRDDFPGSLMRALGTLALDSFASEVKNMESYLQAPRTSEELAVEYTRLFRGPVKAEVYPYESMYIEGEVMGNSTLDVVRRYGEAGVAVANDFKDLPDHISAELEFMHYLCGRELDALQRGANDEAMRFRHMGQAFLRDHLNKWVSLMCKRIRESDNTCFYSGLAGLTEDWLRCEQA